MTIKDMVYDVLQEKGTLSAFEIKGFVYRKYGENISTQSAAGLLRGLVNQGKVARSRDGNNRTVYWIVKEW